MPKNKAEPVFTTDAQDKQQKLADEKKRTQTAALNRSIELNRLQKANNEAKHRLKQNVDEITALNKEHANKVHAARAKLKESEKQELISQKNKATEELIQQADELLKTNILLPARTKKELEQLLEKTRILQSKKDSIKSLDTQGKLNFYKNLNKGLSRIREIISESQEITSSNIEAKINRSFFAAFMPNMNAAIKNTTNIFKTITDNTLKLQEIASKQFENLQQAAQQMNANPVMDEYIAQNEEINKLELLLEQTNLMLEKPTTKSWNSFVEKDKATLLDALESNLAMLKKNLSDTQKLESTLIDREKLDKTISQKKSLISLVTKALNPYLKERLTAKIINSPHLNDTKDELQKAEQRLEKVVRNNFLKDSLTKKIPGDHKLKDSVILQIPGVHKLKDVKDKLKTAEQRLAKSVHDNFIKEVLTKLLSAKQNSDGKYEIKLGDNDYLFLSEKQRNNQIKKYISQNLFPPIREGIKLNKVVNVFEKEEESEKRLVKNFDDISLQYDLSELLKSVIEKNKSSELFQKLSSIAQLQVSESLDEKEYKKLVSDSFKNAIGEVIDASTNEAQKVELDDIVSKAVDKLYQEQSKSETTSIDINQRSWYNLPGKVYDIIGDMCHNIHINLGGEKNAGDLFREAQKLCISFKKANEKLKNKALEIYELENDGPEETAMYYKEELDEVVDPEFEELVDELEAIIPDSKIDNKKQASKYNKDHLISGNKNNFLLEFINNQHQVDPQEDPNDISKFVVAEQKRRNNPPKVNRKFGGKPYDSRGWGGRNQ